MKSKENGGGISNSSKHHDFPLSQDNTVLSQDQQNQSDDLIQQQLADNSEYMNKTKMNHLQSHNITLDDKLDEATVQQTFQIDDDTDHCQNTYQQQLVLSDYYNQVAETPILIKEEQIYKNGGSLPVT